MARQIAPRLGEPRVAILDRRVADLDARVTLLTEAVRTLIKQLEVHRFDGLDDAAVRQATELLLESQRRAVHCPV